MEVFVYAAFAGFFIGILICAAIFKLLGIVYENHCLKKKNEELIKANIQFARKNRALRDLL